MPRYEKIVKEAQELKEEDESIFKMKAKDIYELQEMVKVNVDREMTYDEYMCIFKADV